MEEDVFFMGKARGGLGERVWEQFRKNRLAKASLAILAFFLLMAIYAPFLANNKPFFMFARFPFFYEKSFSTFLHYGQEMVEKCRRGEYGEGDLRREAASLALQAERLCAHIEEDQSSHFTGRLQGFLVRLEGGVQDLLRAEEELRKMERDFKRAPGRLRSVLCFPLLASLSPLEVFLAASSLILLLTLLGRLCFGRKGRGSARRRRFSWGARLGFIILLTLLGCVLGNRGEDSRNYRGEIEEKKALLETGNFFPSVLFPPVAFGYDENRPGECSLPPSRKHPFGTDDTGRDVLARLIWGARISLSAGLVSTFLLFFIGVFLGSLAGYFKGKIDFLLSRFIEVVICFPVFFLIVTLVAFLGPSLIHVMLVIGLTRWTGVARLTRAEFLRLSKMDFVTGAKALGASSLSIAFRHVLPNALGPAIVLANFCMASSILMESALSFLGLGTMEPTASWGGLVSGVQEHALFSCWWLVLFPGLAIFLTVTCTNFTGEALREALDPRGEVLPSS